MPSLGSDMESGTLVEWLVKPGDKVARGDIIAVVETVKGAIEIEVYAPGTVERFLVDVGTEVPVGTPLAIIADEGTPATPAPGPEHAPAAAPPPPAPRKTVSPAAPVTSASASPVAQGAHISPAARRRAGELGIDAASLSGSGPEGAVTLADVEAASSRPPARGPATRQTGMQAVIGAAMERANREIPHYYLAHSIDLEPAITWLERTNLERSPAERLVPAVLLVKAVALALAEVPELNGHWREGEFVSSASVHVGMAVSLRGGGLVAPALHDVAKRPLLELMAALRDLVTRTRAGKLRSSELADGTITVSSLGEEGAEAVFPIIYPPQVAIVGFGGVTRRPWVLGDGIAIHRIVTASLAGDHRVSNGQRGARFLLRLAALLQAPETL